MQRRHATPERLGAFSDGVIAVIITIMVLELKPPLHPSLAALAPLWPTFLSYCVSYLFVGIVWVNHHHLLRFTDRATPTLIWSNLAFLFTVSLIPFATAWMAATGIAAVPVALYALIFCLVNVTYSVFEHEVLNQPEPSLDAELLVLRKRSRLRGQLTLLVYGASGVLALRFAVAGFVLLFANTLVYLVPDKFAFRAPDHRSPAKAESASTTRGDAETS